jgi:hypothetical protein
MIAAVSICPARAAYEAEMSWCPKKYFKWLAGFDKAVDMAMMPAMRQISLAMTKVKGSRREAG